MLGVFFFLFSFGKKINQGADIFTHKHTELPASSFSIKHVCTRLIMLTGGKKNNKIKKLKVARRQSAPTPSTANICLWTFIIYCSSGFLCFIL